MISEPINRKQKEIIQSAGSNTKLLISKFSEMINTTNAVDTPNTSNRNIPSVHSNNNNLHSSKGLLYELTRQTTNKDYNIENYFIVIDALFKVR